MSFVHLHVHTEYSLLDGSNRVKEYVKCVKGLGMNAAAITDHGVMYGVIDFYEEAIAAGIKPIIGCEVYVAPGSRFDKELMAGEDKYNHLVLLAENNKGYENLMKIVSAGFIEGYYYKPRVDVEILEKYHEGIIALSACLAGEVPRYIEKGFLDEARKSALKYLNIFGKGNYFLELQDHGINLQTTVNMELIKISQELDIPLVATNDVHYTYADDAESHDLLLCIQTGKLVSDQDRMRYEGGQYYVKSEQEMRALFPYASQAIDNTQLIADRCNVSFTFGETKLPHFDVPAPYNAWEYLNKLCDEGLNERYLDKAKVHKERLDYELSVIESMGFVEYFLIVWDFINYAKKNNIMVGPGRGSAAGSLVAYCLHITDIDPIKYNLIFERFLNPGRVTMPDIDVDFADARRAEVIEYVSEKYGKECVVQIVTFNTLQAKAAIKDVGRAMDIRLDIVNALTKMVPNELKITIKDAIEKSPDLREKYENDDQIRELLNMSMRLEGLPRNSSTHASGVVICQRPADELVPLCRVKDGPPMAQYTMTTLEHLGLLKMDFLGLRTQTVIQDAVANIKLTTGKNIKMDEIALDDEKVYNSIGTGKTDGVFQLESGGMKSFMKELKPSSLEDLIAGISLYRPGPMDFIPNYIAGKNDKDNITYECKELEPILAPTYGCIVYQEQVMQIVRDLAGFSMGRSDNVRRAMSKKKQSVMNKEREVFVYGNDTEIKEAINNGVDNEKLPLKVQGCVGRGIDEKVANHIYDTMIDFAKYAFNKSHAACYAVVAYQTAYLKYYYPAEYMAALMSSVMDKTEKLSGYIISARNMKIEILPPDINESCGAFAVVDGKIRYALTAIKGVGSNVIEGLVCERTVNGKYRNFQDFIERNAGVVSKKVVENFIKAGAFDSFEGSRKQFMSIYNRIVDAVLDKKKNSMTGQMSLFDFADDAGKKAMMIDMPTHLGEYDEEMILQFEKETLGVYVSGHPLKEYAGIWDKLIKTKTESFYYDEETGSCQLNHNDNVCVAGIITAIKLKYTKKNEQMAFITLEDLVGIIEVIIFPKTFTKYRHLINEDSKVVIKGKVSEELEKDAKLICESMSSISDIRKTLWIQFKDEEDYKYKLQLIEPSLKESDGSDYVRYYIRNIKKQISLPLSNCVNANKELTEKLSAVMGKDNIKITY